jgi:hypothetical protein
MDAPDILSAATSTALAAAAERARPHGVNIGGIATGDPTTVALPRNVSITLEGVCENCRRTVKATVKATVLADGRACTWYHERSGAEKCDPTK